MRDGEKTRFTTSSRISLGMGLCPRDVDAEEPGSQLTGVVQEPYVESACASYKRRLSATGALEEKIKALVAQHSQG